MMVPSSITGRKLSCWARLKRWISSTNSSVPCPVSRRARASSNTFFRSATPVKIAEICSKCRSVACASSRATVVLPVPGGPQNTSEPSERVDSMRVSAPSGPSRWSCPTTSSSFCGRSWSASGRGASLSRPAAANRSSGRRVLARGGHPLNTAEICWPPRRMMMRQVRFGVSVARARSRGLGDALAVHRHDDVAAAGSRHCWHSEPASTSKMTTPWSALRSCNSSASAGDRLATLAPENGERERMMISSRGEFGASAQRHLGAERFCRRAAGRAARCRRAAWWRSGSRRRWDRRPSARRPTR